MIRQGSRQSQEPRFAVLISRANMGSLTPTKRRDSDSQYDVNQSRRPDLSRNTSRDVDRLSTSPLKGPLKKAIEKTVRNLANKQNQMGKSRRTYQSRISRRPSEQDDIDSIFDKMHSETQNFLLKYFDPSRINQISMNRFIDKIIEQYQNLWNTQQAEEILEPFIDKLVWCLGGEQVDWVDLRLLQVSTQDAGVIGLILKIFKELKQEDQRGYSRASNLGTLKQSFQQQLQGSSNVQNIKNIVQEFMESMYKCMQNEVYAKFNVQMRRMVLRYKQSERLLKIVNDKITNNIDIFTADQKYIDKMKTLEGQIQSYKKIRTQQEVALGKEREESAFYKSQCDKLAFEVRRLREELDRTQGYLVKAERDSVQPKPNVSYVDPLLSRHTSQPSVVQFQRSITKNAYSDFYQAPMTTTTIHNASTVLNPTLVSTSPAQIKVQVIQHKEYITTSPAVQRVYRTQTAPSTPSRVTITRLQASPIRSRVVQIL